MAQNNVVFRRNCQHACYTCNDIQLPVHVFSLSAVTKSIMVMVIAGKRQQVYKGIVFDEELNGAILPRWYRVIPIKATRWKSPTSWRRHRLAVLQVFPRYPDCSPALQDPIYSDTISRLSFGVTRKQRSNNNGNSSDLFVPTNDVVTINMFKDVDHNHKVRCCIYFNQLMLVRMQMLMSSVWFPRLTFLFCELQH